MTVATPSSVRLNSERGRIAHTAPRDSPTTVPMTMPPPRSARSAGRPSATMALTGRWPIVHERPRSRRRNAAVRKSHSWASSPGRDGNTSGLSAWKVMKVSTLTPTSTASAARTRRTRNVANEAPITAAADRGE
jgi:hypothetical protein